MSGGFSTIFPTNVAKPVTKTSAAEPGAFSAIFAAKKEQPTEAAQPANNETTWSKINTFSPNHIVWLIAGVLLLLIILWVCYIYLGKEEVKAIPPGKFSKKRLIKPSQGGKLSGEAGGNGNNGNGENGDNGDNDADGDGDGDGNAEDDISGSDEDGGDDADADADADAGLPDDSSLE